MTDAQSVALPNSPAMRRMRCRLERLELDHLRRLCAEQAAQIEQLQADLQFAESCNIAADYRADLFQSMAADPEFSTHRSVGLTRDGELLVVAHEH